jgi:Ca2+-binding EF-hand superfamily protein
MRKAILAAELLGLVGLLLVAADALPQPGPGGGGGGRRGDPAAMFDRFSGGRPTLSISQLPGFFQTALAGYAADHGITSGELTQDQFTAAFQEMRARRQLGGGRRGGPAGGPGPAAFRLPPDWQPPGGGRPGQTPDDRAAEREFRSHDLNRDGFPSSDEIPAALRDSLMEFDADGDGKISLQEYEQYVEARERGEAGPRPGEEGASREGKEERPVVYRAGKLPKGLPAWFQLYDTDGDGQVSLYEWRMAGEPLQKFAEMDRNDDGFLTAEEVLQFEKLARGYHGEDMTAYARLQEVEVRREGDGYHATRHQRFVGTGYFDQVAQCVAGGATSTAALAGSTEEEQFAHVGRH